MKVFNGQKGTCPSPSNKQKVYVSSSRTPCIKGPGPAHQCFTWCNMNKEYELVSSKDKVVFRDFLFWTVLLPALNF